MKFYFLYITTLFIFSSHLESSRPNQKLPDSPENFLDTVFNDYAKYQKSLQNPTQENAVFYTPEASPPPSTSTMMSIIPATKELPKNLSTDSWIHGSDQEKWDDVPDKFIDVQTRNGRVLILDQPISDRQKKRDAQRRRKARNHPLVPAIVSSLFNFSKES